MHSVSALDRVSAMTHHCIDGRRPDRRRTEGRPHPRPAQAAGRPGRVRRGQRPVPGHRLGLDRLRGGQRDPDRALLPVRVGHASSRPTPVPRTATATTSPSCCAPARSASSSTARSTPTARWSSTTASTATASSTSRSRCPTSTSASRRPRRAGATVVREPDDDLRRARHRADRGHRDVRRDPAHPGRPLALHAAPTSPATSRGEHLRQARGRSRSGSSRRSTTSSATSSSAGWTSGSSSTTGSWASRTWRSSSATTSPPTTRR